MLVREETQTPAKTQRQERAWKFWKLTRESSTELNEQAEKASKATLGFGVGPELSQRAPVEM